MNQPSSVNTYGSQWWDWDTKSVTKLRTTLVLLARYTGEKVAQSLRSEKPMTDLTFSPSCERKPMSGTARMARNQSLMASRIRVEPNTTKQEKK